jgi:uncharacterized protein YkwD
VSNLHKLFLLVTALLLTCAVSTSAAGATTGGRSTHRCHNSAHAHGRRCHEHARTSHRHKRSARPAAQHSAAQPPTHPTGRTAVAGKHVHRARAHSNRRPGSTTTTAAAPASGASIASVLATPCQNTELTPEAGNLELIRTATLCLVNQERARNGEEPLKVSSELEQAAQSHTEAMVSEDYFAHVAPNGETPVDRIQATGYIPNAEAGYTLGENIAWGTLSLSTPNAIVAAWIASPEHLENILTSAYVETAIGVTPAVPASLANGQPGAVYGQVFGVVAG